MTVPNVALNLFVNGKLRETDTGSWVDPGGTFFLAGGNAGNDHGEITLDDLRLYDTLLTSDEIWALYCGQMIEYAGLDGDLNGDGIVGSADLDLIRANWGATVTAGDYSAGDVSGDGIVGSADLDIVRANWGAECKNQPGKRPRTGNLDRDYLPCRIHTPQNSFIDASVGPVRRPGLEVSSEP